MELLLAYVVVAVVGNNFGYNHTWMVAAASSSYCPYMVVAVASSEIDRRTGSCRRTPC